MEHGEKFNTYTHLVGSLLALAGSVVLIVLGSLSHDVWKIVSFSIYGVSLVLMYSSSTLYHNAKQGNQKFPAFARSQFDLSAYCRNLYALRSCWLAWTVAMDAVRCGMGAGPDWDNSGNMAGQEDTSNFTGDIYPHGLDRCYRHRTACGSPILDRACMARCRWLSLYHRSVSYTHLTLPT